MNAESLFATVPKEDILALFEAGKPNYQKVVTLLDFKKKDIAKASNVPVDSVRFDRKMPKDLQDRLTEWAVALNVVGQYFKDPEKTVRWFKIPNPLLGHVAPREMIRVGRFNKLFRFILTALNENEIRAA
jgi:hypothetical protein